MKKEVKKNRMARLYDSIAEEYDYFMKQTGHQQAQERILQRIYSEIKGRVLDIATGTGFIAKKIKANCKDVEVIGIDISGKMIEQAKRKAKEKKLKVKFLIGDAEKLNFLDKYFDLAICSLGFLWFQNKTRLLKELKRVVKKRGKIIVIEEEGETVRSKNSLKEFSPNMQKFFSKIKKLEIPVSIKEIKKKMKNSSRLEKEYRAPIDKYHSFVAMVFKVK